jgi:hypothetical protein
MSIVMGGACVLLGLAFVVGSFSRKLRIGSRLQVRSGDGSPAGLHTRIIMFAVGSVAILEGAKQLILCPGLSWL